jgi:hypothetical protein
MNQFNEIVVPAHLRDHDYVGPVNYQLEEEEEIDVPYYLNEHNYANQRENEVEVEQPETYRRVPGVHRNSTIYVDNVGYKYYKREALINTISLVCERKPPRMHHRCFGTASISIDMMDNRITVRNPHNHQPDQIDLNVPFLRAAITERGLDQTNTTASVRTIYNNEIIQ